MKSALQLELENLHGLPYIAGIIWFVLLGICLIAVVIYLFQKKFKSNEPQKTEVNKLKADKSKPKGF